METMSTGGATAMRGADLFCPECGAHMFHVEGCPLCVRWGYSPCRPS